MQQQDEPQLGELQHQQQQPQATSIAGTPQRVQQPDKCGECQFVYEERDRRPCVLPCGHSYCSLCVSTLLKDSHLICPNCRIDHCALEVNHFPINFALEDMMMLRTQQVEAVSQASGEALQATEATQAFSRDFQVTEPKKKRRKTASLSMEQQSKVQAQKESIETLELTLQKEVDQLNQYQKKLAESQAEHDYLLKKLKKVVKQYEVKMEQLQKENDMVKEFVAKGEKAQQELRAAQGQLHQINTDQEASTTIDVADQTIVESKECLQSSREKIPNGTLLRTSFRLMEAIKAALKVITEETEATPDHATSGHSNCTVMEAVESVEEGTVKLVDLHTKILREKVAAGQLFAAQKYADGTCYSSKVICKENKMYLHALKNESLPRWAFTLQVCKALENLNYPDISVFLDLAWSETSSKRVYIKLVADTPLTRQFVTLCLGHTGLTYRNTKLFGVSLSVLKTDVSYYKGVRIIWGGDISGQEAAANQVLPPIQGNECGDKVCISKGMFVAASDLSDAAKRTWFGIVLSSACAYHDRPFLYHIGSVDDDGHDVLLHAYIEGGKKVEVVDCGVVY